MFNIILEQVPSRKIGLMMGVGDTDYSCRSSDWSDCWWTLTAHFGWAFYLPHSVSYSLGFTDCRGLARLSKKSEVKRESLDILSLLATIFLFLGLILGLHGVAEHAFFSFSVLGWLFDWDLRSCHFDLAFYNIRKSHHQPLYFEKS